MNRLLRFSITILLLVAVWNAAGAAQNPLYFKAQQLESKGKLEDAKKIYKDLYKSEGADIYFWKLVSLFERTRDFKSLEDLMLSKLRKSPKNLEARRYLARSYYGSYELEKADKILTEIFEDNWKNAGIVKLVAMEYVNNNEHDKALDIYVTARKRTGNSSLFYLEMSRIYEFLEKYIPAIKEYLKSPKDSQIVYVNLEKMIERAGNAGITYDELSRPFLDHIRDEPGNIVAPRMLSDLMYGDGNYEDSYHILINPAIKSENIMYIWELAERLKKDGHREKALEVYEDYYRNFTLAPNRVNALLKSASIKVELGRKKNALDDYQVLMDSYSGTEHASLAALRFLELSQDKATFEGYSKSLDEFASTTEFRGIAFEAYLILGKALMRNGMFDEAVRALNSAKIKSRNNEEIYRVCVSSALLNFFKTEYKSMNIEIETCLRSSPYGEEINDLLAYKILYMRCSSAEDISGFEEYSHGQYALFRGDTDEAIEHFKSAVIDIPGIASPHAASMLGKLYESRRDFDEAVKWYLTASEAAQDTSVHVGALIQAANIIDTELNSAEKAKGLYLEAITLYPGNVYESELRNKLRAVIDK